MEPNIVFYGPWTIEVTELVRGAGAPEIRLILANAGAADGTYLNPPVGTLLEADGAEWMLRVEVSFDLQPFQAFESAREFAFDPQRGIVATVRADRQNPVFRAGLALRLTGHEPELRPHPADPFDFTIPERAKR
jgi:hypothetical protein